MCLYIYINYIHSWKLKTLYKQRLRLFALDETRLNMMEKNQNTESHRESELHSLFTSDSTKPKDIQ